MSFVVKNYWKFFKRNYYKSYLVQKEIRKLPLCEIKNIQWKRLKSLLDYVYINNDFYKEYFESVNLRPSDIQKPEDMLKLPITEKKIYRQHFDKIISKNINKKDYAVATTSGSTGEPFTHYMDLVKEEPNTYIAFVLNKESMGIKPFEKYNELKLHFQPPNEIKNFKEKIKKSWTDRIIYTFFSDCFGIPGYTITQKNSEDILRIIKENKIIGIYGFPSSVLNLARYVANSNHDLNMKYIITFGEGLLEQQRDYISTIFHCPVFMDYGSSECMRMGFECKFQNGIHMDIYNYYFEYPKDGVSVEKNEPRELIVTNLNNYVFPFIRYKISDTVYVSDSMCNCGINLPIIQNIYGKSIDILKTPSGNSLSSVDFAAFFEHYQKHTPFVRQFQIIQEQEDCILIKIIPSDKFNENIRKDIEKQLYKLTQQSMKVQVIPVEKIEPEKSGKTKVMILKN